MIEWKYTAREKLRDYVGQQNAVRGIPLEIEALRSKSDSIKSMDLDAIHVMGGDATREDLLLSNMVHQAELERMLSRAQISVQLVDSALDVLDAEELRILDLMHIHPAKGKIERIKEEFGLDETKSVYRRVDKALRKFTVAYYGLTET